MRRHAFTLIELLVVVAIIAVLIAILLPALAAARDVAQDVVCRTKQRSIGMAFFMFAGDHQDRLPVVFWTHHPQAWESSWMGSEIWKAVSKKGTLLPYVGGESVVVNQNLYRCPGLAEGVRGSGVGSNGMFDYVSLLSLVGAHRSGVPNTAQVQDPGTGRVSTVGMPLVLEEDPTEHLNSTNIEPGHGAEDRLGTWHPNGGGNIFAADGSSQQIQSSDLGPRPRWEWTARAPSGSIVNLHHSYTKEPGEWDTR
ncbi:prepilin-type N-terminal cleavage/methylation domain-containing protein [Planctomycetales bacterium ZRK34]|nr:prepilin-type N-terminal cleavage/methylation domain-containing protein [Planctomycetales bacterium ZRK34]